MPVSDAPTLHPPPLVMFTFASESSIKMAFDRVVQGLQQELEKSLSYQFFPGVSP